MAGGTLAGPYPDDEKDRLVALAIEAGMEPYELREWLRTEVERRRADLASGKRRPGRSDHWYFATVRARPGRRSR